MACRQLADAEVKLFIEQTTNCANPLCARTNPSTGISHRVTFYSKEHLDHFTKISAIVTGFPICPIRECNLVWPVVGFFMVYLCFDRVSRFGLEAVLAMRRALNL